MFSLTSAAVLGLLSFILPAAAGTGPYNVTFAQVPTLPRHTIYYPTEWPESGKAPVLLWGNGGCFAGGRAYEIFLTELASHGIVGIANGEPTNNTSPSLLAGAGGLNFSQINDLFKPGGPLSGLNLTGGGLPGGGNLPVGGAPPGGLGGLPGLGSSLGGIQQSNSSWQTEALDWVLADKEEKFKGKLDAANIAASGQSCGGIESYEAAVERPGKVKTVGVYNSGLLRVNQTLLDMLPGATKSVFYLIGGPDDIAFQNAERDYDTLPAGFPAYKANLPIGHVGDWFEPNAGKFGQAAVAHLKYTLLGDEESKKFLFGDNGAAIKALGWDVEFKNFA